MSNNKKTISSTHPGLQKLKSRVVTEGSTYTYHKKKTLKFRVKHLTNFSNVKLEDDFEVEPRQSKLKNTSFNQERYSLSNRLNTDLNWGKVSKIKAKKVGKNKKHYAPNKEKVRYKEKINNFDTRKTIHNSVNKYRRGAVATLMMGIVVFSFGLSNFSNNNTDIAGVKDTKDYPSIFESNEEYAAYSKWEIANKLEPKSYSKDNDNDGLFNYEEFLLNSDPNGLTCSDFASDSIAMLALIDFNTCSKNDISNPEYISNYSKVISFTSNRKGNNKVSVVATGTYSQSETDLKKFLEVGDYNNLDSKVEVFKKEIETIERKIEYISLIQEIDNYITLNRSTDEYDKGVIVPLEGAYYLETSMLYGIELSEIIAIAQLESKFGTDQHDNTNNLNQLTYSRNLMRSRVSNDGEVVEFDSWKESLSNYGVISQGINDENTSKCLRLAVYSSEENYCQKVKVFEDQWQEYLNSSELDLPEKYSKN